MDLTYGASNDEEIEIQVPFQLEPDTLSSVEMHGLALCVSIKAEKSAMAKLEVNCIHSNSIDNPHSANLTDSFSNITQKLIYKELGYTNLLSIKTQGKPKWITISKICLKVSSD